MKILITGAEGTLGKAVSEKLNMHELLLTGKHNLDVRHYDKVMAWYREKPDIVIHLAAETDHNKCKENPAEAYFTNHTGTQNMVLYAWALNIPVVYVSSSGVFGGNKDFYVEDDVPNPINHYHRSKYYGENVVRMYKKHYLIRTSWLFGGGEYDKKFLGQIYRQAKQGSKIIYALDDVFGSPTYVFDLAQIIRKIIEKSFPFGTYHAANEGKASRWELADKFIRLLGKEPQVKVMPVYGDYFGFDDRPKSEVLKNKILNEMDIEMHTWQEALADYVKKEFLC